MYKKIDNSPQMGNLPYFLDGTLNPDNRWVKLGHNPRSQLKSYTVQTLRVNWDLVLYQLV